MAEGAACLSTALVRMTPSSELGPGRLDTVGKAFGGSEATYT